MIITKEQQEALVDNYVKQKHTTDECIGFIDGLNAALNLAQKLSPSTTHFFKPSEENNRFCECGAYLTDDCHNRNI